ncbi:hypothetical protein EVAR_38749_1 [Eumeta japonica]|uniref:Uncharacterized protein n=1 Tax=Eumeta variegata TaxID=151549 RepID=A0A4C1YPV0_EUMVA|nr:hypothetical protein EVAR_38749_1 [Eumeta japonica]
MSDNEENSDRSPTLTPPRKLPKKGGWTRKKEVVERILEQWEALRLFIDFTTNPAHRARADKPFPNTYATYGSGPRIIAPADYAKKQIIDNQWRTLPNARARHPQSASGRIASVAPPLTDIGARARVDRSYVTVASALISSHTQWTEH